MKKWNLIVDVELCNNCANCSLAALDEHVGNDFPGYAGPQDKRALSLITLRRQVRGSDQHMDMAYMPTMCNHCDRPACAEGAGNAVVKRPDGIVLIDPIKAKGRRDLVDKCPYGAIQWNEAEQLPQIWIFDAHLLDAGWHEPRCQQACPTGAYRAIKVSDADMQTLARQEQLHVDQPELGCAPRVYYKNLHRMQQRYIAGSVLQLKDGQRECLPGCSVTLLRDGQTVAQTRTDWFGDFKFDALPDQALSYTLLFAHLGKASARIDLCTEAAGNSAATVTLTAVP